jgi:hypothetical protein
LLGCLAALTAACGAGSATAAVYWGNNGYIGAANLDGSEPDGNYFKGSFVPGSSGPPCDIAVSPTYLYWAGTFGIDRLNLDGPAARTTIVPGRQQPCGIAVDAAHVYWAEPKGGTVARANLDGTEANAAFVTGLSNPCDVAVDGTYLYWMGWTGIGRARVDGSGIDRSFIASGPSGCGIAVDAGHVYWTSYVGNQHAIGRANLDGSEPDPDFIPNLPGTPGAIALDPAHVYWTEWHEGMNYATIGRASLDGSGVNSGWILTQWFNLGGLAVDARPTPPPRPVPSGPIHFGQLRHNLRTGVASLDVYVPARGTLAVVSPKLGWKVLTGPMPSYIQGSFRWRLKIWPGKSGKVAKQLRTKLREKGKAAVTLTLSYAEERQLPLTATKRISLWKTRSHSRHR